MTYVFVVGLTALMMKFIWDLCKERVKSFGNWCWQQMKFAGGWCWRLVKYAWNWCKWCKWCIKIFWTWCKFLWKNPASLFLTLAGLLILIALVIFAPYFYKIYFVLSSQINTEYFDAVKQAGETGEQVGGTGEQVGGTGEQVGEKENINSYFSISIRYFGIVAAVGAIIGYIIAIARNITANNQNKISEQTQITESIGQAITQIGEVNVDKPNIEVRLGGLYSLQRIMQDSSRDEESLAKIFYAYVRENTKIDKTEQAENTTPPPREDVQAALDIINQFSKIWRQEGRKILSDSRLNFSRTNFSGYSFTDMDFSHAILEGATLSNASLINIKFFKAKLMNADLSNAKLMKANLSNADLTRADLTSADLTNANLFKARLWRANLPNARLIKVNLSGVDLINANLSGVNLATANLSGADFSWADLSGANLSGANLSGTDLYDANLEGANFSGVDLTKIRWLTQKNINKAKGDKKTKLPDDIIRPESWDKEDEDDGEDVF